MFFCSKRWTIFWIYLVRGIDRCRCFIIFVLSRDQWLPPRFPVSRRKRRLRFLLLIFLFLRINRVFFFFFFFLYSLYLYWTHTETKWIEKYLSAYVFTNKKDKIEETYWISNTWTFRTRGNLLHNCTKENL